MSVMQGITDAHSHIGLDILHTGDPQKIQYFPCPINDYLTKCISLGITKSVISYVPCPEIRLPNNSLFRPCFWVFENGEVNYYKEEQSPTNQIYRDKAGRDPYQLPNNCLLEDIKEAENDKKKVSLYALGLHHPILDTEEGFDMLVSNPKIVGIKLHGLATYTSPKDIPKYVTEKLRFYDKPLVVHTDYKVKRDNSIMERLYNANDPLIWARWAVEEDVRVLITHGARLCLKTIDLANKNIGKIFIGVSPDKLLTSESEKLKTKTNNFLGSLISMSCSDVIIFDIDYAWNIQRRDDWQSKDWTLIKRLELLLKTDKDREKVFHKNASILYGI